MLEDLRGLVARAGSPAPCPGAGDGFIPCTQRALPEETWLEAARTAVAENPANAPHLQAAHDIVLEPQQIAMLTSKYWGPQTRVRSVSFMESTPADLRARIVSFLNLWATEGHCGIRYAETGGVGDVRISRGPGGYYAYLGTDNQHIPANRQTMNLEGFTMQTPESEFFRVVPHEGGHDLGFVHEHMRRLLVQRIDPVKARAWFLRTQGWSAQVVQQQVLTSIEEALLTSAPVEQESAMCYQLPGSITFDGLPITGGTRPTAEDLAFAARIYPLAAAPPPPPPPPPPGELRVTLSADAKAGTYALVGR